MHIWAPSLSLYSLASYSFSIALNCEYSIFIATPGVKTPNYELRLTTSLGEYVSLGPYDKYEVYLGDHNYVSVDSADTVITPCPALSDSALLWFCMACYGRLLRQVA